MLDGVERYLIFIKLCSNINQHFFCSQVQTTMVSLLGCRAHNDEPPAQNTGGNTVNINNSTIKHYSTTWPSAYNNVERRCIEVKNSFGYLVHHRTTKLYSTTVFSQLNAPGVYFKLGMVDPAFL